MEEILAEHTGQQYQRVHDDLDRDFILTPEDAVAYGVVDRVVSRKVVVRSAT
jgi:ATP-dependent Clp protease protease subunit